MDPNYKDIDSSDDENAEKPVEAAPVEEVKDGKKK